MEDKKQEKVNEQEENQDVLELIGQSLDDVSGGIVRGKLHCKGGDIDKNSHWHLHGRGET